MAAGLLRIVVALAVIVFIAARTRTHSAPNHMNARKNRVRPTAMIATVAFLAFLLVPFPAFAPSDASASPTGAAAGASTLPTSWYQHDWGGGPGQLAWSSAQPDRFNKDVAPQNTYIDPGGHLTLMPGSGDNIWATTAQMGSPGCRDALNLPGEGPAYLMGSAVITEAHDIEGTSPSDVWALLGHGEGHGYPLALHYNGTSWRRYPLGSLLGMAWNADSFASADARALFYPSPGSAWAACGNNFTQKASVLYFNGEAWTMSLQTNSYDGFTCVAGSSEADIWASGQASGAERNLLFHYDGNSWSQWTGDIGSEMGFSQLSVLSATDAYGYFTGWSGGELYHYNGRAWVLEQTDTLRFRAVRAVAPGAVYAVREADSSIYRLQPGGWAPAYNATVPGAAVIDLTALERTPSGGLAVAGLVHGGEQDMKTVLVNLEGATWSQRLSSQTTSVPTCLYPDASGATWAGDGFWGAGTLAGCLQVGGSFYRFEPSGTSATVYDSGLDQNHTFSETAGQLTRIADTPEKSYSNEYVVANDGTGNHIFAIGPVQEDSSNPDPRGRVYRYDEAANTWSEPAGSRSAYSLYTPRGVSTMGFTGRHLASSGSTVHVVSGLTTGYENPFNPADWIASDRICALAAADETHAWALGARFLWDFDGAAWRQGLDLGAVPQSPGGAAALGPARAYALYGARLFTSDGASWSLAHDFASELGPEAPAGCSLGALDATSLYAAFAGGTGDVRVFLFDGSSATQVGTTITGAGGLAGMRALAAADPAHLWLSSGSGVLYAYEGADWAAQGAPAGLTHLAFASPSDGYALSPAGAWRWQAGAWGSIGGPGVLDDISVPPGGPAFFRDAATGALYSYNGGWATLFAGFASEVGNNTGELAMAALASGCTFTGGSGENLATFASGAWTMRRGYLAAHQSYNVAANAYGYGLAPVPYPEANSPAALFAAACSDGRIFAVTTAGGDEGPHITAYDPASDAWERQDGHGGGLAAPPAGFAQRARSAHILSVPAAPDCIYLLSEHVPGQARTIYCYNMAADYWDQCQIAQGQCRMGGMGTWGEDGNIRMFGGLDLETGSVERDVRTWYNWGAAPAIHSPGGIESSVFDLGADAQVTASAFSAGLPAGTQATLSVRSGESNNPDAPNSGWTPWRSVSRGQVFYAAQYLQYRVDLSTSVNDAVPRVDAVGFTFARAWFLAEGCTRNDPQTGTLYETYVLVANPTATDAKVNYRYMLADGGLVDRNDEIVPAHSRVTKLVAAEAGEDRDVSTMVLCTNGVPLNISRSVYFTQNGRVGSTEASATRPAPDWYFAEGCCRPAFETYICINNPGDSASTVSITYMRGDGVTMIQGPLDVAAHSRRTIVCKDFMSENNVPEGTARDFSTRVVCTQGPDVVVERPMYFNYQPGNLDGGHAASGSQAPAGLWYLPEGTCRYGYETYLCLQNPGSEAAGVTISYMKGDATTTTQWVGIPAETRVTVHPADVLGVADDTAHDFASRVSADRPVVAERVTYYSRDGVADGTCSMGVVSPRNRWCAPEGYQVPGDFDTYVLIQNPHDAWVPCNVRFMTEQGRVFEKTYGAAPLSRTTVWAGEHGGLRRVGVATQVSTDPATPVVVEQAIYSSSRASGATTLACGWDSPEPVKLHKLMGIGLQGSNYWANGPDTLYFRGLSVSYFMDNPATIQDEGIAYKRGNFTNVQIYVPYDWFLPQYLSQGVALYTKVFERLAAYEPQSVCVNFIKRQHGPPGDWDGWGKAPNGCGPEWKLDINNQDHWDRAGRAFGLDLDNGNWQEAIFNFCRYFGSRVKYFEIIDEPSLDIPRAVRVDGATPTNIAVSFYGNCEVDYPRLLQQAYATIKGFGFPQNPVVITGSLLTGAISHPEFTNPSDPARYSYGLYRKFRDSGALAYCDAIGVHFWQCPYDTPGEIADPDTWSGAYNYMRNDLFADDNREIIVASCGWPWAVDRTDDGHFSPERGSIKQDPEHALRALDQSRWNPGEERYGISSLFYDTTCPAAWYFFDVNVCFTWGNWLGRTAEPVDPKAPEDPNKYKALYCGLGNTYSNTVGIDADPLGTGTGNWITDTNIQIVYEPPSPPLWEPFAAWMDRTE